MKIFEKWTTSLITLTLIGLIVIGAYHFAIKPNLPPEQVAQIGKDPAKPSFDTVDSSSCILCHTNEAVILASKVGQEEEVAESSGG